MTISFNTGPAEVASEALGLLGRAPISDLENTDDPVCVQCKQYFSSLLRTMLRDHTWKFAKHRQSLSQDLVAPLSGWTYGYTLPTDCFRVLQVNDSDNSRYEIEGRTLLSDEATILLEFIRWEVDTNVWTGDFYQAFVTLLASRLAGALNTDKEKASDLYKLYMLQVADAKATNGQETPTEAYECTLLTTDIRE